MVHLVTYDMSKTLHQLTGSRSNPVTIDETRNQTLRMTDSGGAYKENEKDTRRYAEGAKDKSVVVRQADASGTLAPNGDRNPAPASLGDPGDGLLDQLPGDIAVGQTWSFTRAIKVDRTLGQGTMTYTDKLDRIETRNGHRIAIVDVTGAGRVDVASDLQAKGFHTAPMQLTGSAEFDITDGLPGKQHCTAHVEWVTRILFTRIGVTFDDTYDATPWTVSTKPASP